MVIFQACTDVDECSLKGMYACHDGAKTGRPDKACVNTLGSYKCVDTALVLGTKEKEFYLLQTASDGTVQRCNNHGLPNTTVPPYSESQHVAFFNDRIAMCAYRDIYFDRKIHSRHCEMINLITKEIEPMA